MPIVYQIFPVHVKKRISFFFAFSSSSPSCSSAKFCLGTKLATYRSFNPFIINLLREDVEKEHRTSSNERKTMDWLVFFSRCHDCLGKVAHILLFEVDRGSRWENSLNSMKSIWNNLFCWPISWLVGLVADLNPMPRSSRLTATTTTTNSFVPCAALWGCALLHTAHLMSDDIKSNAYAL